jgi:hypothetical protein
MDKVLVGVLISRYLEFGTGDGQEDIVRPDESSIGCTVPKLRF